MDVCAPGAMEMRSNKSRAIEGESLSYMELQSEKNCEWLPEKMVTFPQLTHPVLCNGCRLCENECPVSALTLQQLFKKMNSDANLIAMVDDLIEVP